MDDLTRRDVLQRTASAGLFAALSPGDEAPAQDAKAPTAGERPEDQALDRRCVLGAGMTEAEADCWELAAKLAGKYFELPEQHPMERQEIVAAIHVIQYRLLARPTYRTYRELHKAPADAKSK